MDIALRKEKMEQASALAETLLQETLQETTQHEKRKMRHLARLLEEKNGLSLLTLLADRCFRSASDERTAKALTQLLERAPPLHFLPLPLRVALFLFRKWGRTFPHFFISQLKRTFWREMKPFFREKKAPQAKINLNHIGEAVLGEEEASQRMALYLADRTPDQISIKISSLYSQINLVGWEETLGELKIRFRKLLRSKQFVSLDMEEYKDVDLTLALFMETLSEEEFATTSSGIVLQSYLPDAFALQKQLTAWAKLRDAPIRLRIVKGANLAMEKVESSLRRWPQAPFEHKAESDANFLRMLEYGCHKEHAPSVHIGVGSHNLFDIAYALVLREHYQTEEEVSLEMLQGMAPAMQRALQKRVGSLLLYTPEVKEEDLHLAAPYLIRRLDENSAPENFLRHLFDLRLGSKAWEEQKALFLHSGTVVDTLPETSRRSHPSPHTEHGFYNEPDTDFSIEENRRGARAVFALWKEKTIPKSADCISVEKVFSQAKRWEASVKERSRIFSNVAALLRARRRDFIGAMIATCSKTYEEADTEVSEAIDFVEYYWRQAEELFSLNNIQWEPKGIILVAPPWNFPISIPIGGVAAALITGNAVLLKPAPEAVFLGQLAAQAFWDGGVPQEALQFLPCPDEPTGSELLSDARLDGAILTGATQTAQHFLSLNPWLDLMAETGGKNALIVTAMADRDLALSDAIKSAFGHAGQKCSACSLLILEKELYDAPHFLNTLRDAASSLIAGSSWNKAVRLPPLIRPPDPAIFRLDEGESWLLEPTQDPSLPLLYTPGIKLGVKEKSRTHQTEFFAPLLGVMRAENLEHAIHLANGTPYGLTSGLHTLDEEEQRLWKEKIVAGNLYINRTLTGAIVQRQPFGGTKASGFGPGAKAGGPHYLLQLVRPIEKRLPRAKAPLPPSLIPLIEILPRFLDEKESALWKRSAENYAFWVNTLKRPEDRSEILGQKNLFYMVPHEKITLRLRDDDPWIDVLRVIAAALCCQTPLEISCSTPLFPHPAIEWRIEERKAFLERVGKGVCKRIRLVHPPSRQLIEKAAEGFAYIACAPVLASGRIELLHYLREVALSHTTHRYGWLPPTI